MATNSYTGSAISLESHLSILKQAPDVDRQLFQSVAEMVAFSTDYLPPVYEANTIDGRRWRYNVTNDVDPITGKWREAVSDAFNVEELPEASSDELGKKYHVVADYTPTGSTLVKAGDYVCVSDGATPPVYSWEEAQTNEKVICTQAEYDALPASKLTDGKTYYITDGASPGGVEALSELSDVDITTVTPEDGECLSYDSSSSKWIPSSIIDVFYPVGSVYETTDTTFDPNTSFGGTWIEVPPSAGKPDYANKVENAYVGGSSSYTCPSNGRLGIFSKDGSGLSSPIVYINGVIIKLSRGGSADNYVYNEIEVCKDDVITSSGDYVRSPSTDEWVNGYIWFIPDKVQKKAWKRTA